VEGTLDPLILPMAQAEGTWHPYTSDKNIGGPDESAGSDGNNWTPYGGATTGEQHDWRGGSSSNQNGGWGGAPQLQRNWSSWENQTSCWDQGEQDPWQKEGQDPWCKKNDDWWFKTSSTGEKDQGELLDSTHNGEKSDWELVQQNQLALEEKVEQRMGQVEQKCKATNAVAADVASRLEGILAEAKSLHEKTNAVLGQQALLETLLGQQASLNLSLRSIADSLSATRASFRISAK